MGFVAKGAGGAVIGAAGSVASRLTSPRGEAAVAAVPAQTEGETVVANEDESDLSDLFPAGRSDGGAAAAPAPTSPCGGSSDLSDLFPADRGDVGAAAASAQSASSPHGVSSPPAAPGRDMDMTIGQALGNVMRRQPAAGMKLRKSGGKAD